VDTSTLSVHESELAPRAAKPEWAMAPINRFLAQSLELRQLFLVTMQAMALLPQIPKVHEVMRRSSKDSAKRKALVLHSVDPAEDAVTFAIKEAGNDYSRLSAQAAIGLWAAFEVMIEDLVVAFLMNDPSTLSNEIFSKIKLPLAQFELFDKEERMRFLFTEFEKGVATGKHGVKRVEMLLQPFGLTGVVEPETARLIRELHFVRNVLVHRASIADRRIVEGCPWLKLTIGPFRPVKFAS
jgi:hypothetical protein